TSQLADGTETAFTGAGIRHDSEVAHRIHVGLDGRANFIGGFRPDFDDALVLFLLGEQAAAEVALDFFFLGHGLREHVAFLSGDGDIRNGDGDAGTGGVLEANVLHAIYIGRSG